MAKDKSPPSNKDDVKDNQKKTKPEPKKDIASTKEKTSKTEVKKESAPKSAPPSTKQSPKIEPKKDKPKIIEPKKDKPKIKAKEAKPDDKKPKLEPIKSKLLRVSRFAQVPVRVSPLIKAGRWAFLLFGIFYGSSKRKFLAKREVGIRAEEKQQKAIRDLKLKEEKDLASALELAMLTELFLGPQPKDE